jgi:predicted TPR repeat methyltransferase
MAHASFEARRMSFEARYRAEADPWQTLASEYEAGKRERTLAACGPGPFGAAIDLGAGLGLLSEALAPRCEHVVAVDGSRTAARAAAMRLRPFPHAEVLAGAIPEVLPAGRFDLVVASEILYYLDDGALTATLRWIARHLDPGGRVVAVHWTGDAHDLTRSAAAVSARLAATPGLRVVEAEDEDGYRLDVLERSR